MAESVRLVVLIAFCSQGDNVLDATGLVSYLDEWLKLKTSECEGTFSVITVTDQKVGALFTCSIVGCFILLYGQLPTTLQCLLQ